MSASPPTTWFRISRLARDRYGVQQPLAGNRGHIVATNRAAIRDLAARVNATRAPGVPSAQAGELAALALMHEVFHVVIERYEADHEPNAMRKATEALRSTLRLDAEEVLASFQREFPNWDATPEPLEDVVEEILLTRVANENPAAEPLRELFDDRPLAADTRYGRAVAALDAHFAEGPAFGPDNETLLELLRAPARHSPTSLSSQLRYIRENWSSLLGDLLGRLLGEIDVALGVLAEEERAMHLRFGGGHGGFAGRVDAPSYGGLDAEPERFSNDAEWMPQLVLMAKSTYVWLDQLSRKYSRDIRTLDAIPDEELDQLARWGVSGLWLIGLWERSRASERIKRMRGNEDAVASAYSLQDYRIADDLGGEAAYANLRDRAWARRVRLASDMVPNHMGIDSSWVMEHPEWFVSLDHSPYPGYSFNGPDLSSDPRAGVVLEDHYWDNSDAAVVFKRFDRASGDSRYIYHGNDGTSFPWNDTAQLDFLKPEVREAVIQAILDVARRFPVIRFDAAMVLAKKHIERLWWPEPGQGGGIPSRAEHAMPKEEFDRHMPAEFWRDVVERVRAEVPDTLLLAEAFWLLEGYFVRTLGMHRVYNSAFMHMLRDEDNAGYRTLIKDTLDFDPGILKRYVNFMNNPDEETAVEQFGKGDKYFGIASVLATMPGLPMVGHGQVEGFTEKYGMEFRRARLDEQPDRWLVERHEREIFPLFHRRGDFAEADNYLLFDLVTDDGHVDENVLAYSNGNGGSRSLVIYHNRFASTAGTVRDSVQYAVKHSDGSKSSARRSLAEGLGLSHDPNVMLAFRDVRSGLEFLRSGRDIHERGMHVSLGAYEGRVFLDFHEIHDPAGVWRQLADRLQGSGVPSLVDAFREYELQPVHDALQALLHESVPLLLTAPATRERMEVIQRAHATFLDQVAAAAGTSGPAEPIAAETTRMLRHSLADHTAAPALTLTDRAAVLARILVGSTGQLVPEAEPGPTTSAWYRELRLSSPIAAGLREAGLDEAQTWGVADLVGSLLALPLPGSLDGPRNNLAERLLSALLSIEDLRPRMGLNVWEGVEWIEAERFDSLLRWMEYLDGLYTEPSRLPAGKQALEQLRVAAAAAGYRVDRLREAVAASARPAVPPRAQPGRLKDKPGKSQPKK